MSSPVIEHNRIERDRVKQVAAVLQALFADPARPPLAAPDSTEAEPLPLVASLDDAPPLPIAPGSPDADVYAIDGGSSVLAKGGNVEVIAWRAGSVRFKGHRRLAEECPGPELLGYNRLDAMSILRDYLTGASIDYVAEIPPMRLVDALRWLDEWRCLKRLVEDAAPDSLILVDGSLRCQPGFDRQAQRDLMKIAAERDVAVAAVSKQSSLTIDSALPLEYTRPPSDSPGRWFRRLNRQLPDSSGWLGNVFLARLHPGSDKPYRIDINRFDTRVEQIMAALAALADDIEFAGYPYPLVAAHRLARIDAAFKSELVDRLGQVLADSGFPDDVWSFLTGDIHDKLNADIMERFAHA